MSQQQQYRQGDVLLVPRREPIPAAARPRPTLVLAEGEVTGHAHRLDVELGAGATLYEHEGALILRVAQSAPAPLVHEEHATIHVMPGNYDVVRQVEWDPEMGTRQVQD